MIKNQIEPRSAETSRQSLTKKKYHPPLLIDWGDLQSLTKGSGGIYNDGDLSASSNISGQRFSPDINDPNNPYNPNNPNNPYNPKVKTPIPFFYPGP